MSLYLSFKWELTEITGNTILYHNAEQKIDYNPEENNAAEQL